MLQIISTSFWDFISSLTDAYNTLIAFHNSNPFAFNVFAFTVALPFIAVYLFNIIYFYLKYRDIENDN